jgi:hypothetical protein
MQMQKEAEANALSLAEKLIAKCHEHTSEGSVAVAALRVSLEVISSGLQVSATALPEACSVPSSESQAV